MKTLKQIKTVLLAIFLLLVFPVSADVGSQVKQLNKDMDAIERDVSKLEENLLFPPVTRTKVFLSLAPDADFTLRSVSLRIDNREQTFHIYTPAEIDALRLGGIQSLWEGNVALGQRHLVARFEGSNRKGDKVKGEAALTFEKTLEGRSLELQVLGGKDTTYSVKDWGVK